MRKIDTSSQFSRRELLKGGSAISGVFVASGIVGTAGAKPGKGNGKDNKCDIVVPDDESTIQAAVDKADSGDTICIEQGTYEEDVTVDTDVTLRGRNAPKSENQAELDGDIEVTPGGDGTTIRRLRIAPSETFKGGTFPDPFGVQIKASDVVVENNIIEDLSADLSNGEGSFTVHGIQIFGADGADVSDVTVRDNVIRGFESEGDSTTWPKYGGIAGVKVQADVETVTVTDNEITDHHSAGWVWGVVLTDSGSAPGVPEDVKVTNNDISELNDGSEYDVFDGANDGRDGAPYPGSAFGIDGDADADEATVKKNNLLAPNGIESKDEDNTLIAECNWWDDKSGPTYDDNPDGEGTWALERGDATIDYTPWLTATAPSNACNGGEKNNNGKGN